MKPFRAFSCHNHGRVALLIALVLTTATLLSHPANAQVAPRQISQDSFTNQDSQHMTEVEPSAFSRGSVIVAAFQVARISSGGGADIGFATSTDAGRTWTNG